MKCRGREGGRRCTEREGRCLLPALLRGFLRECSNWGDPRRAFAASRNCGTFTAIWEPPGCAPGACGCRRAAAGGTFRKGLQGARLRGRAACPEISRVCTRSPLPLSRLQPFPRLCCKCLGRPHVPPEMQPAIPRAPRAPRAQPLASHLCRAAASPTPSTTSSSPASVRPYMSGGVGSSGQGRGQGRRQWRGGCGGGDVAGRASQRGTATRTCCLFAGTHLERI